jgi:fermentation-respiration switch protein FrsA (DUF1100 family)
MPERISFGSDGLKLAGLFHVPAEYKPGNKYPTFIVMHGFGGSKESGQGILWIPEALKKWGYAVLQFDFRGCGESEGERGRVICLEEASDISNAITYLESRPEVDSRRIALFGTSLSAGVSIHAAAVDQRAAAVIAHGGWGNGARKFRFQHLGPEWDRFMKQITDGIRHREATGKSMMIPRYDVVPIPPRLRSYISNNPNARMEFTAETPLSMYLFQPEEMIGRISPRPVMLIHGAADSVTPASESLELFKRAKSPTELHIIDGGDHFLFAEDNKRVVNLLRDWLDKFFPAQG